MVLLALLVWNIRFLTIHSLVTGPDAPSSTWDTQITSPRVCSWLHVGRFWQGQASSSFAVPLQLVFCHASLVGPGHLLSNLLITKSQWSSYKAIYHWIYCLMQNTILSFTDMNSWKRISAYLFADLLEKQKWIHHLHYQKSQAQTVQERTHIHKDDDRNSSGTLHV